MPAGALLLSGKQLAVRDGGETSWAQDRVQEGYVWIELLS